MTIREKRTVWNQAIRFACDQIMRYDGIIPDKIDREYMKNKIEERGLYKRLDGVRKTSKQRKRRTPKY